MTGWLNGEWMQKTPVHQEPYAKFFNASESNCPSFGFCFFSRFRLPSSIHHRPILSLCSPALCKVIEKQKQPRFSTHSSYMAIASKSPTLAISESQFGFAFCARCLELPSSGRVLLHDTPLSV